MIRKTWWMFLAPVLAGCVAGAAQFTASTPIGVTPNPEVEVTPALLRTTTATPEPRIEVPAVVPDVDVTKHSVPLDDVYFDTFWFAIIAAEPEITVY